MAGSGSGGSRLLTVVSATVLIATEAFATAAAAGWALAGLFNLGRVGQYGFVGVFSAIALYVTLLYLRRAASVEMAHGD